MGIATDTADSNRKVSLVTSREPVGPNLSSDTAKSDGERALMDALVIIGIAWAILIFLAFSLRSHNV